MWIIWIFHYHLRKKKKHLTNNIEKIEIEKKYWNTRKITFDCIVKIIVSLEINCKYLTLKLKKKIRKTMILRIDSTEILKYTSVIKISRFPSKLYSFKKMSFSAINIYC